MAIITLISDWYKNDYYTGAVKGKLFSLIPDVSIIDISHDVPPFNIAVGAFILKNCLPLYPEGTVHIICLKSEISPEQPCLIANFRGQYIIGADNGFFSLLIEEEPAQIYKLKNQSFDQSSTFPELDIFTEVARDLIQQKNITTIAEKTEFVNKNIPYRAAIDQDAITGSIIYFDSYQNAVTNITRKLFQRIGNSRAFEIFVQSHYYKITKMNKSYEETTPGELLALFNSADLLEVAIQNGNAKDLLNLSIGSTIRIKFKS